MAIQSLLPPHGPHIKRSSSAPAYSKWSERHVRNHKMDQSRQKKYAAPIEKEIEKNDKGWKLVMKKDLFFENSATQRIEIKGKVKWNTLEKKVI